jgi:coatomer subunit beta'
LFSDGERLELGGIVKDMGSCEVYPQKLEHSPNGRYVVACGGGEWIIYTATALRNKCKKAAVFLCFLSLNFYYIILAHY